jgi:hypothetical protein
MRLRTVAQGVDKIRLGPAVERGFVDMPDPGDVDRLFWSYVHCRASIFAFRRTR